MDPSWSSLAFSITGTSSLIAFPLTPKHVTLNDLVILLVGVSGHRHLSSRAKKISCYTHKTWYDASLKYNGPLPIVFELREGLAIPCMG